MQHEPAHRTRYLSAIVVLLLWAHSAWLSLASPGLVESIATSLPRLALYATGLGAVTALLVTGLLRLNGETLRDLGFTSRMLGRQLAIGTLFGFVLFLAHQLAISPLIDALLPASAPQGVNLAPLFGNVYQAPIWIFLAVFKGGFVEEGMRVFGLTRFERILGKPGLVFAALVGSAAFGAGHLYQGLDSAIGTGIQGLLFVAIYLRKRRTLEAVTAHAVYDLIGITLAYAIL
ncbi:MAG: CPBP family intramembrane metalloprotease [bacterium]|nr:CPBP family intramembrane metalloprotease [bacterium]